MLVKQVGELLDGGYWYIVPITRPVGKTGDGPSVGGTVGYCATYVTIQGRDFAVIRSPEPIEVDDVDTTVGKGLNRAEAQGRQPKAKKLPWRVKGK